MRKVVYIITIKGTTNKSVKAFPNAVIDLLNPKQDKITQRRFYDEEGNVKVNIDLMDHGHSKVHSIVPHAHDGENGERQRFFPNLPCP
ncbi:hypothetical protein [Thermoanaerobacter sp. A7A]|uniref:hypothetical protein n=1 Tax=Thermoanaerobacter sp. A7A TaxID=1350366 RepID=UPI0004A2FEF2|nr:hypothetical protein [Thermoanaerobacter sp. A7A]